MTVTACTIGPEMTDLSVVRNGLEVRTAIETGDMIEDGDGDENGPHKEGVSARCILI
jgi:hypothetical protein